MPLLAAADAPPNAPLCKPKFSGIVVISGMYVAFNFLNSGIRNPIVLNMRHSDIISWTLEISNLTFCKYASIYLTGQHSDFILDMWTTCSSLCWSVFDFGIKIFKCLSCNFMFFSLTSSILSIHKNPAKPNKHVNKNLKSGIVEFSHLFCN